MQDYSKILTERGLIPRFSEQEVDCEVVEPAFATESELLERMESSKGRFGAPHAWFFPFLGRKVRTPLGPGTLIQVFAEKVTVLLDTDLSRCTVFTPREIAPCDWSI